MKAKKLIWLLITLALLVGVVSGGAAMTSAEAADWPWTIEEFYEDEGGVLNLSTAFAGQGQFPVLSYNKTGSDRIFQAFLVPGASYHNCGPGNAWSCTSWRDKDLVPGTVSDVVTHTVDADTFKVMWAYMAGYIIRVASAELKSDLSLWADTYVDVLNIDKFSGVALIGAPSLQYVDGRYQAALTVSTAIGINKLIFVHYSGVDNTSCLAGGSKYQCDVIETVDPPDSIGPPSLRVSSDGVVGIAYTYIGDLKYAYPWDLIIPFKSPNCGPGDNTWRCIVVSQAFGAVGNVVKQGIGLTHAKRGIAYTQQIFGPALLAAEFVGSGGNCGLDGKTSLMPPWEDNYSWYCSYVDNITYNPSPSFSIAIDPEGFPVIAYDNTYDDLAPTSLYLAYPEARIGDPGGDWIRQTIDPAPDINVHVGGQPALALNAEGLGFIAYRVDDGHHWTSPLKIALQQGSLIYLPLILR